MALGDIKVFEIAYEGLKLSIEAVDCGDGTIKFNVTCLEGYADINALWWSDGDGEASEYEALEKSEKSLNMNGSGEEWDGYEVLSSAGLGTDGTAKETYLTEGETYSFHLSVEQLDNITWEDLSTLGVRATSTSTYEGSIKGVDDDAVVIICDDTNILVNGSFEVDGVPKEEDTWTGLANENFTGWDSSAGGIEIWHAPLKSGGGLVASDGNYLIETDWLGVGQSGHNGQKDHIGQTVDAETGVEYTLTFDYASRQQTAGANNTTDSFEIYWNDVLVGSFDPSSYTEWTTATITVTGADGDDRLEIRETGADDSFGALIDNVSLVRTCECDLL